MVGYGCRDFALMRMTIRGIAGRLRKSDDVGATIDHLSSNNYYFECCYEHQQHRTKNISSPI